MRWLKLTLSSLTLALVICAPALAQSSPTASQYDPLGPSSCDAATEICAQSVDDSVQDIADDAEQGTAAVNGAMNEAVAGPAASTSEFGTPESGTSVPAASASPEAVLSSETAASPGSATSPGAGVTEGGATTGGGESPSSITVLPETGGASPVLLGLGVLLVASSLLTRGVIKR